MFVSDFSHEIYTAITVNKMRTGLTILGIIIGIGSVIAMVAIGKGAQISVQQSIEAIGSNLLIVRPGAQQGPGSQVRGAQGSAQSLTEKDVTALETKLESIEAIAPEVSGGRQQVTAQGNNVNTSITGVTPEYATVRNITVAEGSFLNTQQERGLAKVAFIGPDVNTELFGENVSPVGKKIRIGKTDFTIIGLATARGGSGFGSSDDFIYVPLSTAKQFFSGDEYLSSISIKVKNGEDMTAASEEVTTLLHSEHKLRADEEDDFSVLNQADIVSTASSVTSTFTTLLGAVAGISLIVGGIGIMNMMLTTVTERTREIGLRKAIGAEKKDIQRQFLFEAIVLTFFGGIVGILFGWLAAVLMNAYGINAEVSLDSILLAFVVSAGIGIIFGYYPAHRASQLRPIEALRYE